MGGGVVQLRTNGNNPMRVGFTWVTLDKTKGSNQTLQIFILTSNITTATVTVELA